jgi:hypothetical protein
MKNDAQERNRQEKIMKKSEKNYETWWKREKQTMKNDEQERSNNEPWWKREKKTMKNDEHERKNNEQ